MKLFLFLFLTLTFLLLMPSTSFANGGDQRVVEGKYLINLSRSPFTPKAGENVAMIASFFDFQKNQLIAEDLIVKVRIAKLGEGRGRTFIFEKENVNVKGGILESQYIFAEPGLHEVFFDFAFASSPQKVYNAPDFLLDIQKAAVPEKSNQLVPVWIGLGAVFGFGVGWLVTRRKV